MASESNSGIVAIVAIMILVLLGGLVAWRMGVFGGGGDRDTTRQIEIDSPIKTETPAR